MQNMPDLAQDQMPTHITLFQALVLLQVQSLSGVQGSMESYTASTSLTMSIAHHLAETGCSEADWAERAQARALERLGLLEPSPEAGRWSLTPDGELLCRLIEEELAKVLPVAHSPT